MIETDAWGSELASWTTLTVMLGVFGLLIVTLLIFGRGSILERIPEALQRLTGIPGWAAAAVGTSFYGLLIAGEGFYSDVAWHIALGRDEVLMTAPHTAIVIGLGFILVAAALGTLFATVQRVDTRFRIAGIRVPLSMLPLTLLGLGALAGFPLDELWHARYGVDVTMWSPTHMLLILGASLSGLAAWLVLAEAGVSPTDGGWARAVHVVAGALTFMGLTSAQGEFDFGVPQFQQIFHPILVTGAAAFGLVAIRLVHGRFWALGIVVGSLVLELTPIFGDSGPVATRDGGLYIVSALLVELTAGALGTRRRMRFALVSGAAVATIGLAAEWVWNQGAHQPWRSALLPDALILSVVIGLGAAVLGATFGTAVARDRSTRPVPPLLLAGAGLAVLVALVLPMPRATGDVTADIRLEAVGDLALVHVTLDPPDAADEARWFQTIHWQGGGLMLADMVHVGPGQYVTDQALPVDGRGKTLVRLHRGGEMMAAPVYFPADSENGEPEIPAVDRTIAFAGERDYLLRETTGSGGWFAYLIYGLLAGALAAWVTSFGLVARHLNRQPDKHSQRMT